MSWLATWLRNSKLASIEKMAQGLLKVIVPILAPALKSSVNQIWNVSKDAVISAEATGGSGDEKFENAFKFLTSQVGEISKVILSVAIELAVSYLRVRMKI